MEAPASRPAPNIGVGGMIPMRPGMTPVSRMTTACGCGVQQHPYPGYREVA